MKYYIIKCITGNDLGSYWSNKIGWIDEVLFADIFNQEEKETLNLPIGGEWLNLNDLEVE